MCPVCVLRVLVSCPGLCCSLALQDLKIALANTPSVHPLFVLYCTVYYKSVCGGGGEAACGGGGGTRGPGWRSPIGTLPLPLQVRGLEQAFLAFVMEDRASSPADGEGDCRQWRGGDAQGQERRLCAGGPGLCSHSPNVLPPQRSTSDVPNAFLTTQHPCVTPKILSGALTGPLCLFSLFLLIFFLIFEMI